MWLVSGVAKALAGIENLQSSKPVKKNKKSKVE